MRSECRLREFREAPAESAMKMFSNATKPLLEAKIDDIMRHCTVQCLCELYSEMARIVLFLLQTTSAEVQSDA